MGLRSKCIASHEIMLSVQSRHKVEKCPPLNDSKHSTLQASTLYNTDSYVVSLVSNPDGTGLLSGHADGSVVRWYVADDPNAKGQVHAPQGQVGQD